MDHATLRADCALRGVVGAVIAGDRSDAAGRGEFAGDQHRSALPQSRAEHLAVRPRSSTGWSSMDEHARLHPGPRGSWKLVAPDTWELKLRDAKFQNGNAFVADDVVFTMDRIPNVPNSPSNFAAYTKPVVEHRSGGSNTPSACTPTACSRCCRPIFRCSSSSIARPTRA